MATALLASRAVALPSLRSGRANASRPRLALVAQAKASSSADLQAQLTRVAGISTAVSTFLVAGNAQAAQEVATLAASGDGRLGSIFVFLAPALAWVGYNIFGPAKNQLDTMSKPAKGFAAALGLTAASLIAAQSADAVQEVAELAAKDNRTGTIALLFLPVLGWVGYNILGPAKNQLDAMSTSGGAKSKRRGIAAGLGLAASALMVQHSDAATELAQLAERDNRFGTIALLFVPVLGWVLYNILSPAKNQLDAMTASGGGGKSKRRGLAAGLGLAASALLVQHADAATELAQIADKDNRFGTIALLFVPVLGWVLYNILGPALNQVDSMTSSKPKTKKK